MSSFVEVSGMVQQDDVDYQPRRAYASTSVRTSVPARKFSISDVWAAACAAQRVNGEYVKEEQRAWDEASQTSKIVKRRNRDIMLDFLNNPSQLLVEDVEQGEEVRNFLQNDLTFRAVKGKLTEFDSAVSRVLAVKEEFDTHKNKYELAVVAALPASAARTKAHQAQIERTQFAKGGLIGQAGDKIQAQVEVLSSVYSKNYDIYWIKGITDRDQPVFFSSKEAFDTGTWLTVKGTVKGHRDDVTQLNRVKVL